MVPFYTESRLHCEGGVSVPDPWASPLLDDVRIYDSRGVMIPRDPATAIDADGEPIF